MPEAKIRIYHNSEDSPEAGIISTPKDGNLYWTLINHALSIVEGADGPGLKKKGLRTCVSHSAPLRTASVLQGRKNATFSYS